MKMGENAGEPINESLDTSKKGRVRKKQLYNSILQLMEFYFSDANLSKDRFLMQLLQNDPYVEVDIFLKFNKIRKLNCSAEDIKKAIGKSELLELSEDREKVKRKTEVHQKENVDSCTIYVENIKADATHESLSQIFSEFGKVVYVSIPKYKHNKANKGFAFIEFESESDTQNTLEYFASIGCRMPADTEPDKLVSIQTFEESENMDTTQNVTQQSKDGTEPKKRKIDEEDETNVKKMKTEGDCVKGRLEGGEEKVEVEEDKKDGKKKKKHKKDKKKNHIKEMGLQILSKVEWKKMRNRYLNLQRKKMKELKQYLHKQSYNDRKKNSKEEHATKKISKDLEEFVPGIIVKMVLPEPCLDAKKMKSEMRATSPNIKFVDVPNAVENNEVYLRFSDSECAKKYVSEQNNEDRQFVILEGDEEKRYWHKLKEDRERFEEKKSGQRRRKQRGRDKLIKRAEKEAAKHIFFEGKEGEDVNTAIPSM